MSSYDIVWKKYFLKTILFQEAENDQHWKRWVGEEGQVEYNDPFPSLWPYSASEDACPSKQSKIFHFKKNIVMKV